MFVCSPYFTLFAATPNIIVTATKKILPPLQLHLIRYQLGWTSKVFSYKKNVFPKHYNMTLFKDCCHSEKGIFSFFFSNSFLSNSNSFLLNSKISEQQRSACRGYYENWRPKILPVDRASFIGGGQTNGTTKKHNRGTKNQCLWTGPKSLKELTISTYYNLNTLARGK